MGWELLATLHADAAAATSGIPVLVGSSFEPLLERAAEQVDRYGQGLPGPAILEVQIDPDY